jgi:hypothetical protein
VTEAVDKVRELSELPQSDVGSPMPIVLATEHTVHVFYAVQAPLPEGAALGIDDPVAHVTFSRLSALKFGSPNDEALTGHPLYARGLRSYSSFEVHGSSWIKELEHRNRVHPRHSAALFAPCRHFALTFHDTTLEVVCDDIAHEVVEGPIEAAVRRFSEQLVRESR